VVFHLPIFQHFQIYSIFHVCFPAKPNQIHPRYFLNNQKKAHSIHARYTMAKFLYPKIGILLNNPSPLLSSKANFDSEFEVDFLTLQNFYLPYSFPKSDLRFAKLYLAPNSIQNLNLRLPGKNH
jgi:hypothetical protein